jgi:hypothetical protein
VDASALKILPDFLLPDDRTAIERRVARLAPVQPTQCSDSGVRYFMVEVVGDILQSRDVLAIEVDEYRKRFRSGPWLWKVAIVGMANGTAPDTYPQSSLDRMRHPGHVAIRDGTDACDTRPASHRAPTQYLNAMCRG